MGINYSPTLITDGMILCLDGSNRRSYPGTGVTWTDLSSNGKSGTGQTGVTYSSLNSGKFILNGDLSGYFSIPLVTSTITNVTMSCWVNITTNSLRGPFIVNGSANGYAIGVGNDSYDTFGNNLIALFPYQRWISTGVSLGLGWKHVAMTLDGSSLPRVYLNGQLINSYAGVNPGTPTTATYIGREVGGENVGITRAFGGEVGMVQMYNRRLSDSEILQNYNAQRKKYFPEENTVNSNLVLLLDAGKANSYSGTGTSWIDLSGSGITGALTNGPTFSGQNGGEIVFDGSNDFINIANNSIFNFSSGFFTISVWVNFAALSTQRTIITNYNGSANGWSIQFFGGIIGVNLSGDGFDISGTTTIQTNTWYNVVVTGAPNLYKLYINNVNEGNTFTGAVALNSSDTLRIGQIAGGAFLSGRISNIRIYNRTLTTDELTQNYNALKIRFGL